MTRKANGHGRSARYETVQIDDLRQSRKGKHYDFVAGVLADLQALKAGTALKIPLQKLEGSSVMKVRSAITRGAATLGRKISTLSDAEYLYVWPKAEKKSKK